MSTLGTTVINFLTAILLAGCLLLVFVYDRSKPGPGAKTAGSRKDEGKQSLEVRFVHEDSPTLSQQKRLRLAVVVPVGSIYDDMGKLLGGMGEGYQFQEILEKQLKEDPNLLDQSRWDVVFLTCQGGGTEYMKQLFNFVNEGGVLYASDHRYMALKEAFPTFVDTSLEGVGSEQVVTADVMESDLREAMGNTLKLGFDKGDWVTAAFAGKGVSTLLQGRYRKTITNEEAWAPLLVKFQVGKGTVIFTSFHNEKQNSEIAKKLLQHLVFRLVTAHTDAHVTASIQQGGFSTKRSNLLGMGLKTPPVTKTYRNETVGPLRFALGFRNEGARLAFTIRSPDGKSYRWEGNSTVVLEVPQAGVGEWSYTVAAESLPYENFPFTVRVGGRN